MGKGERYKVKGQKRGKSEKVQGQGYKEKGQGHIGKSTRAKVQGK